MGRRHAPVAAVSAAITVATFPDALWLRLLMQFLLQQFLLLLILMLMLLLLLPIILLLLLPHSKQTFMKRLDSICIQPQSKRKCMKIDCQNMLGFHLYYVCFAFAYAWIPCGFCLFGICTRVYANAI